MCRGVLSSGTQPMATVGEMGTAITHPAHRSGYQIGYLPKKDAQVAHSHQGTCEQPAMRRAWVQRLSSSTFSACGCASGKCNRITRRRSNAYMRSSYRMRPEMAQKRLCGCSSIGRAVWQSKLDGAYNRSSYPIVVLTIRVGSSSLPTRCFRCRLQHRRMYEHQIRT